MTLRAEVRRLRTQRERAIRSRKRLSTHHLAEANRLEREVSELRQELARLVVMEQTLAFGKAVDQAVSTPPVSLRESEVLRLTALDYSNKQIGKALNISERTAKFHVSNLLQKFRVNRRGRLPRLRAVS